MSMAGPHHIKVHRIEAIPLDDPKNAVRFVREDNKKPICTFYRSVPSYTVIDGNANGDELASVIAGLAEHYLIKKQDFESGLYIDSSGAVQVPGYVVKVKP